MKEYRELELIKRVNLLTEEYFNLLAVSGAETIIPEMVRLTAEKLAVARCYLLSYSEERKGLELEAWHGFKRESFITDFLPLGEGIEGVAARDRAPQKVAQIESSDTAKALLRDPGKNAVIMAQPLIAQGELLGVMTVISDDSSPMTPQSEQLFSIMCSKGAQVLKRALMMRTSDRRAGDYLAIMKIMEMGNLAHSIEEFIRMLEEKVPALLGVSECAVDLHDMPRRKKGRFCQFSHFNECTCYVSGVPQYSHSCREGRHRDDERFLCLPLKAREEKMGILLLREPPEEFLLPSRRRFAEVLGRHISSALHRFIASGRYEKKLEALSTLYEVAQVMSSTAHLQDALDLILKLVARLLNAERVQIMLLSDDEREIEVRASWSVDGKSFGAVKMKVGEGVAGWVIKHGKPYFVRDTGNDRLFIPSPEGQKELKSILCVPIMEKTRKMGVINIGTVKRERDFTDDEIQTLSAIASRAAMAIENARLAERLRESIAQLEQKNMQLESGKEQLQRKGEELTEANRKMKESLKQLQAANRQLAALYEITRNLGSTLDLEVILDAALQKIMKIFSSPLGAVVISLLNRDKGVLEIAASRGLKRNPERAYEIKFSDIPDRLIRALFVKQKHVFLENREALYVAKTLGLDPKVKAFYIWPLLVKGNTMGVLTVTCGKKMGLQNEEKNLLFAITQQISVAIDNSRLYQDTKKTAQILTSVHEIITAMISDKPVQERLQYMTKSMAQLLGQEFSAVALLEGGRHLKLEATYGLGDDFKTNWHSRVIENLSEDVLRRGKVFISSGDDGALLSSNDFLSLRGIASIIIVPLKVQDKTNGILMLGNYRHYEYSVEEINLLLFLADQVALGIENVMLYKNVLYEKNTLTAILSSIGDGVVTLDWNKKITSFNPAASEISGWTADEVIGRFCPEVFHGKDKDGQDQCSENCPLLKIIESGPTKVIKNKGSILTKDGRERFIEDTHSMVTIGDDPMGAVIVFRDVTEERMLQQMKSDFIASVAHDLKTPLAAIKGYAMTLIRHGGKFDKDTQREFCMIINSEIDRLTRLLENLLNLTKMEVGKLITRPEEFNTLILAKKVKDLYQINTSKHEITIEGEPNLPYAYADIDQVEQILNNLISNAIKYSPSGGTVTVRLKLQDSHILISTEDEGIGIPDNELENIFERYHRVESSSTRRISGTGLGLFITKILVEAQNGTVWAESTAGRGSRFFFTLPVGKR